MIVGKIGKFNSHKCNKCGSDVMFIKVKGNNVGLYCRSCGAWQKWLNKNEKKLFENNQNREIEDRLKDFIDAIEDRIDAEMMELPKSDADQIRKSACCLALEQCKTSLENILADREFNDYGNRTINT